MLELTWVCKGQLIKTIALVDNNEGIIYDNIASYAINYKTKNDKIEKNQILKRPLTRADTELVNMTFADSIAADTSYSVFTQSDISDEIELITGKKAWWYFIQVTSAFNRYGRLGYRNIKTDSDCALGWQCQADAKTISGELNVSDYHEFAWAWAYGNGGTTIHISFLGNGFSVTGGERRSYSTGIHRP